MKSSEMVMDDVQVLDNIVDFNEAKALREKHVVPVKEEVYALSCEKEEKGFVFYISKTAKRILDIIAGIVGIIILIPLTIIIYIANKICKEDGPIFFVQERIGKDGKIFKMIKYRSMVVGAEERLRSYLKENPEARAEYKKYKKLKDDPRITKIGSFLRKTSLDEMPQLIHLLTGEMTLVGPRPYLPHEKEDMGVYYGVITKYKPGITGLWQVSGRSNTTFDSRLDIDTTYHKFHSFRFDIKILYRTFVHVVKKEGAM